METQKKWLAIGYSVPINPSRNRVYVWRKLKEFGAEYFKQGVALLPANKKNVARLNRLAQRISELGGEAQLVEMRFLNASDETEMIQRFKRQADSEYISLLHECADLLTGIGAQAGERMSEYEAEQIKKMVRRYALVKSRDHFHSGLSGEFEEKIYKAIDAIRATASDLAAQLSHTLQKIG